MALLKLHGNMVWRLKDASFEVLIWSCVSNDKTQF